MIPPVTNEELRAAPALERLTDAELEDLASHMFKVHVNQGSVLIRQGDSGFKLFVVLDGEAQVVTNESVLAQVGPGDLIGEVALVTAESRNADVVAISPMTLAAMTVWDFTAVTESSPPIRRAIADVAAQRRR